MNSRRKTEEILMDLEIDLWSKGYGRLRVKSRQRMKSDENGNRIFEPLGQQLHKISVEIAVSCSGETMSYETLSQQFGDLKMI